MGELSPTQKGEMLMNSKGRELLTQGKVEECQNPLNSIFQRHLDAYGNTRVRVKDVCMLLSESVSVYRWVHRLSTKIGVRIVCVTSAWDLLSISGLCFIF